MHPMIKNSILRAGAALTLFAAFAAPISAGEAPSAAVITERLTPVTGDEETMGNDLPSIDLAVEFEYDSARLTAHARGLLSHLAASLRDPRFSATVFGIYGHSDAAGQSAYNLKLSEKRALAVADYLASLGVVSDKLQTRGFGETRLKHPHAPNSKANRRVEIVNLTPELTRMPESSPQPAARPPDHLHQSISE